MPGTTPETAMYKVVVADTGIGMSKEYLPHILKHLQEKRQVQKARFKEYDDKSIF